MRNVLAVLAGVLLLAGCGYHFYFFLGYSGNPFRGLFVLFALFGGSALISIVARTIPAKTPSNQDSLIAQNKNS